MIPDHRHAQAARIFRAVFALNTVLTVFWLYALIAGRVPYFWEGYQANGEALVRVLVGIAFFYVVWGFIWWVIKGQLLRRFVGFSREEVRQAFSSRTREPFEVADLTARYSERRIRIVDMIGRRGRFITLAAAGLYYLYVQVATNPTDNFASAFLGDNLFDALVTSWVFLGLFYSDHWVAAMFYGPQSRVMDGVLARANCLTITSLWLLFKVVLVPVGAQLAVVYPREEFAVVFVLIWGAYLVTDASAEIVGSLIGRQQIRVWGVGDINRKSIAGTVGGFLAALTLGVGIVLAYGLGPSWIVLAVVVAVSNSLLELYSPRGTDDFTMATANALICLAFGLWFR